MRLLDRYIIKQFLINYLLAFTVLVGLYVLLDLIINFSRFTKGAETVQAWALFLALTGDIVDYYAYQILVIFQMVSGVIPLLAAGFTMFRLTRNNELTAMLASGVSLYRVAVPVLLCALGFSFLVVVDQELLMPGCVDKLLRRHDQVGRPARTISRTDALHFIRDADESLLSAGLYNANAAVVRVTRVTEHEVDTTETLDARGRVIAVAENRVGSPREVPGPWAGRELIDGGRNHVLVDAATGEDIALPVAEKRPLPPLPELPRTRRWSGKTVEVVKEPVRDADGRPRTVKFLRDILIVQRDKAGLPTGRIMARSAVWTYSPDNGLPRAAWLFYGTRQVDDLTADSLNRVAEKVGNMYYTQTRLSPEQLDLVFSKKAVEFLSSTQISQLIANSPDITKPGLLKIMHIRFTQPIMNLIMLLLGIPFLLTRVPGRLVVNLFLCVGVVGVCFVGTFVFFQLAGGTLPPQVGAWLPVVVFGPTAVALLDAIKT